MPQFPARPCNDPRRRSIAAGRGCLAVLMAFAIALTAMLHGPAQAHAAVAPPHEQTVAAVTQDLADEHCCPSAHCPTVGKACAAAGSCSLCVPPPEFAGQPSPTATESEAMPETPPSEALPFAFFRPPKALPTV